MVKWYGPSKTEQKESCKNKCNSNRKRVARTSAIRTERTDQIKLSERTDQIKLSERTEQINENRSERIDQINEDQSELTDEMDKYSRRVERKPSEIQDKINTYAELVDLTVISSA